MPKSLMDNDLNAVVGGVGQPVKKVAKVDYKTQLENYMMANPITCNTCGFSHTTFNNAVPNSTNTALKITFPCRHSQDVECDKLGIKLF